MGRTTRLAFIQNFGRILSHRIDGQSANAHITSYPAVKRADQTVCPFFVRHLTVFATSRRANKEADHNWPAFFIAPSLAHQPAHVVSRPLTQNCHPYLPTHAKHSSRAKRAAFYFHPRKTVILSEVSRIFPSRSLLPARRGGRTSRLTQPKDLSFRQSQGTRARGQKGRFLRIIPA